MSQTVKQAIKRLPFVERLLYQGVYHWQTNAYVISYPKSGRTWLRTLMGRALAKTYEVEMTEYDPSLLYRTHSLPIPLIRFAHDLVAYPAPNGRLIHQRYRHYRRQKVILLVRDPRDVLVSYFFHRTRRLQESHTLDEFLTHPDWGLRRQIAFLNGWMAHQHVPRAFLLTSYRALHAQTAVELRRIFDFLAVGQVTDAAIETAVAYASFARMKARSQKATADILRPTHPDDPQSAKVREGKVGGYQKYLTSSQIIWLNETIRAELHPQLQATLSFNSE